MENLESFNSFEGEKQNKFLTVEEAFDGTRDRSNLVLVLLDGYDGDLVLEPNGGGGEARIAFLPANDYEHPLVELSQDNPDSSEIINLRAESEKLSDEFIFTGFVETDSIGEMHLSKDGVTLDVDLYI